MAPLSNIQKLGLALISHSISKRRERKERKYWVKNWLLVRQKISHMNILCLLGPDDFRNFLRMDSNCFEELLGLVTPYIQKEDTVMRESITAKERLVATLRYLATGQTYEDLKYSAIISPQSLSKIIPETCWAIYKSLKNYIKMPETQEDWKKVSKEFEEKWNFNHCLGSIDGKHVAIEKPPGSGSTFYNYKQFFSTVLLAIVNANYEFMYVSTGINGSVSDGGVIKNTSFYKKLVNDELNLPPASNLPGTSTPAPYVFVGDSAFALNRHVMKPYPFKSITRDKRIFNYRLSRARRVVENAFGILAARFRIFRRDMAIDLENVDAVVLASCALHNYLRKKTTAYVTRRYVDNENTQTISYRPGDWRRATENFVPLANVNERRRCEEGHNVRNAFKEHFNGVGSVSFQDRMIDVVPL